MALFARNNWSTFAFDLLQAAVFGQNLTFQGPDSLNLDCQVGSECFDSGSASSCSRP